MFDFLKKPEQARELADIFQKFEIGALIKAQKPFVLHLSRSQAVQNRGRTIFLIFRGIGNLNVKEDDFYQALRTLEENEKEKDPAFSLADRIANAKIDL